MKTNSFALFCAAVACLQGCQQIPVETVAIQQFNAALADENLEQLRKSSSEQFDRQALRRDDSLADLKFLKLPEGEVEVVRIHEIDAANKQVEAAIGERKQKLMYHLRLNSDSQAWEVDDIYMKQRHDGVIDTRTVTEQMDLLMTVRDFMEAAEGLDRTRVLDSMTTDFRDVMDSVPDKTFNRLTEKVAGKSTSKRHDPQAQMNGEQALVRLHRLSGELLLTLKVENDTWKIDNLAVESRDDNYDIPNMRKTVASMQIGADFLRAYAAGEREQLQKLATPKFYQNSIEYADLSSFPLAVDELLKEDFQVRAQGRIATILIPLGADTVSIDLAREEFVDNPDQPERYLVEEVTLFQGNQQIQMSSVFVSQARMQVYANALREGRFDIIRNMSTPDFAERVWSKIEPTLVPSLPLTELRQAAPKVLSADYRGKLTQFRVMHGDEMVTYHLRDWNGEQLVDDITVSTPGQPESLKETLAVLIPAQKFIHGLQSGNLETVQAHSSADFNLLVWRHLPKLPPSAQVVAAACRQPLTRLELAETDANLTFDDGQQNTRMRMRLIEGQWTVDEVHLTSGGPDAQVAEFKQVLRQQLATGELRSASAVVYADRNRRGNMIEQVGYEVDAPESPASTGATPKMLTPEQVSNDSMQLDQLPALDVPRPATGHPSEFETDYVEPEIIRAHGESPFQRKTRKISPMSPIWKQ